MRFDSFKSRKTFGPQARRWVKLELAFHQPKKTTRDCLWDYTTRHYPLKTFNGQLSVIMGHPRGEPVKTFGMIKKLSF